MVLATAIVCGTVGPAQVLTGTTPPPAHSAHP